MTGEVRAWFNQRLKSGETLAHRHAMLGTCYFAGSGGYGIIGFGGATEENPWGADGLSHDDFLEFQQYEGVITGFLIAGAASREEIREQVKAERQAAWTEFQAKQAAEKEAAP